MSKRPNFKDARGHHIRVYSEVYDSPAYKALTPPDVMAYLALLRDLKGSNNGDLSLTLTKAKERGISHHTTLARSLRALCAVGLICLTRKGGSQRGGQRLPSLYAVTDIDVYEMRHKQVEARKADFAWRKVTTVEHGRSLIEQAEANAKKGASKLKPQGHKLTATGTPADAITPLIRPPGDTWQDIPGHLVTHGKNSANPMPARVTDGFSSDDDFRSHRTRRVPPIHIATPSGEIEGDSDREAVPQAVTRKAAKYLANLPRGAHDVVAIQAGRGAGLSLEQLSAWADPQTVALALAGGSRPWRDLWTLGIDRSLLESQA
jgi:hypothetical protein